MRTLENTEVYKNYAGDRKTGIIKVIGELGAGRGDIAPRHIEPEMAQLKIKTKTGNNPFLKEAISLYEIFNGRVRLFDLGVGSSGMPALSGWMPFLIGQIRDRIRKDDDIVGSGQSRAVLMNMYTLGGWSIDEKSYDNLNYLDLRHQLIMGNILHKMILGGQITKLLSNASFLENMTRLYVYLFEETVKRAATTLGDANKKYIKFMIAKFFLTYVLEVSGSLVDDIAFKVAQRFNDSSLEGLKMFEDSVDVDYTTLSGFLKSIGEIFFQQPIDLHRFQLSWTSLYGEGMFLAIEYFPYLLHFLISRVHGAPLGRATKLYTRDNELRKEGLIKMYQALVSTLN